MKKILALACFAFAAWSVNAIADIHAGTCVCTSSDDVRSNGEVSIVYICPNFNNVAIVESYKSLDACELALPSNCPLNDKDAGCSS